MAKKVRVELNSAGVRALLKDPGVAADLAARGERIAATAGEGFESSGVRQDRDRVAVTVRAATEEARRAEAESRALLRALDAGR